MMPLKNYFKKRVVKFRKTFSPMGVGGFIIEDPTDLFYFTGLKLSQGTLLVDRRNTCLFVDGRYYTHAKKESPYPVRKWEQTELEAVLNEWKGSHIFGFDTRLSVASYRKIRRSFSRSKKKLKGFDQSTLKIRAIKDPQEQTLLQASAALLWKGFIYLEKKLKVGITELELARDFEFYVKKNGAESLAFPPIIAFGENTALPHHCTSSRKLKKNEAVLIDIGIILNGYASDMTRTVFFGAVSKKMEELFRIVKEAHQKALEKCRAGEAVAVLDRAARDAMRGKAKYFLHALGHGIGLDVHEYPRISSQYQRGRLEEGMVITIEPGLYLPRVGGVRYEDMIVITKKGYKNFFKETTL